MNQVNTGKFIKEMRKELKMTQRELAERLNISDKTVSKWETGGGLPDVGLMLPLCNVLGISVNELLSAQKLDEKLYHIKAEENIMDLIKEKAEAKKKISIAVIVSVMAVISGTAFVVIAGLAELPLWARILLISLAVVVIGIGIGVACVLDKGAGYYECPECKERFVPSMGAYVMGPHTILKRQLKCPNCGKIRYCRKRLTK